jgi:hypothetical protein
MTDAEELLIWAWAIIANAGGGDWSREPDEWRTAAVRFRDEYHRLLARQRRPWWQRLFVRRGTVSVPKG